MFGFRRRIGTELISLYSSSTVLATGCLIGISVRGLLVYTVGSSTVPATGLCGLGQSRYRMRIALAAVVRC